MDYFFLILLMINLTSIKMVGRKREGVCSKITILTFKHYLKPA